MTFSDKKAYHDNSRPIRDGKSERKETNMYPNNNRRPSRRVNDEFLRRMVGGELTGGELPVINMARMENIGQSIEGNSSCNQNDDIPHECPTMLGAPSLAMVYSPLQCWRSLLEPEEALQNGSLFAELVMPFEGANKSMGIGGRLCK